MSARTEGRERVLLAEDRAALKKRVRILRACNLAPMVTDSTRYAQWLHVINGQWIRQSTMRAVLAAIDAGSAAEELEPVAVVLDWDGPDEAGDWWDGQDGESEPAEVQP